MGGVNSKADGFPQDAPGIWSHVPTDPGYAGYGGYEDDLQLPPCKIISAFDGTGYATKEIVEIPKVKEQSPVKTEPVKTEPVKMEPVKTEPVKIPESPKTAAQAETLPVTDGQPGVQELHGRRKSLLIGINYFGSAHELHGCVDDVHRMLPLVETWGFTQEGCSKVLLDSPGHQRPTKANIQSAIKWLVEGASPGDALFFHYSGHGGRVPRTDGRGEWHETLCPVDMDEEGQIHDNELFEMLVKPLPKGCRLTCILDACHSAGALDLPFIFTGSPENIKKAMAGEAIQMALSKNWVRDFERWSEAEDPMALLGDVASVGFGLWDMWKQYKAKTEANQDGFCPDAPGNIGMASAEVVAITGCASDQTSADVGDVHSKFDLKDGGHLRSGARGEAGGALTCAFIEAMDMAKTAKVDGAGDVSIVELLEHLRQRLAEGGFEQVPQLASSLVLDLQQPFSLTTVIGTSAGNNLSGSSRCLGGASTMGSMGSAIGNGLCANALPALAGNALGATTGESSLLGALGSWGAWPFSSTATANTAPAPEAAEYVYGDEDEDDEVYDDSEDDFEDEYSEYEDED